MSYQPLNADAANLEISPAKSAGQDIEHDRQRDATSEQNYDEAAVIADRVPPIRITKSRTTRDHMLVQTRHSLNSKVTQSEEN